MNRGNWKFNKTLLNNEGFVEKLKIVTDETTEHSQFGKLNPAQTWENLKFEISRYSQEQPNMIAKSKKEQIKNLQAKLEKLIDEQCTTLEDNQYQINEVESAIQEYYQERTKACILRSKARWYGGGRAQFQIFLQSREIQI